jgi:hypothetical protein
VGRWSAGRAAGHGQEAVDLDKKPHVVIVTITAVAVIVQTRGQPVGIVCLNIELEGVVCLHSRTGDVVAQELVGTVAIK